MQALRGKNAVVTGASSGIGRATAVRLGAEGARVMVHYNSHPAAAEAVVAEIVAQGGKAESVGVDLAAGDAAHRLASHLSDAMDGRLDVAVLNAGVGVVQPFEEATVEQFDATFAVNVRAPFFLTQRLLPMLGEGASVVFVTSLTTRSALGDLALYASSKGALEPLVRYLAALLGPRGIRVNAVAPGSVETPMSSVLTGNEVGREMLRGLQALKRIAQPDDVADVIAFLASDEARWITGERLRVDGGTHL